MFLRSLLCLLSLSVAVQAGLFERKPDFTNYDVPLEKQVVNRIRQKILARLGEGENTRDRYFIIPFAYENDGNDPEFSHSFISVIRVLADKRQRKLTPGIKKRTYKDREFEAFTISWLPHDFPENPNLCVFDGVGARVSPERNKCPVSVGKNFDLPTTLKLAVSVKNAVCIWGPYEVRKEAFDLGVKRKQLLDRGKIKYRADDRGYRERLEAINCFHAMAGLNELYPNGGLFGTGFKMWGINGTTRVLIEYKNVANFRHVLLEPVDVKKDRYGFVYAPSLNSRKVYNPFVNSSAYHR